MIIVMAPWATADHKNKILDHIQTLGLDAHLLQDEYRSIIAVMGDEQPAVEATFETWAGVERVMPVRQPFQLASREFKPENSFVRVGGDVVFGGDEIQIIAGPCAVEDEGTALAIAAAVKAQGCKLFRGGAFKPRTSPYSFQGLGEEGLRILSRVREKTGLKIVTEVLDVHEVDLVAEHADMLQVGTRNMANYRLLKALGAVRKPVLLKRGMSSTIKEFLMAAEYILANGNPNVVLCERGIRTFENYTRFNLDISAVPAVKRLSHLPIIVDPSHATGQWRLVEPVALAGIAAGADGVMIEVHTEPQHALSDGSQALKPERLPGLLEKIRGISSVLGRRAAFG
ncbi:MAG TPA: 3-deoxy-7-phosphoheptulonate synthase [Candidatus Ozemobacteraceae bacterium]|nr:3-deoxy-7-phosphoheptulonate synthase [Candidatus Ozemobacteraceae bacterium]